MNSVIVTGASGFVGSHFVRQLSCLGIPTLALIRKPLNQISPSRIVLSPSVTYLKLDLKDISSLASSARNYWDHFSNSIFFNLAWGGVESLSDLDVTHQLHNVSYSLQAYQTADMLGCIKFVQVCTMEEAFCKSYLTLDHNADTQYNRHVIYALSKLVARNALSLYSIDARLPIVFATNSHVMGPDDDKDSFLQVTIKKLVENQELIFSSGEQMFDVISVSDCVQAYIAIGRHGRDKANYCVGSGSPRPLRSYIEELSKIFPSPRTLGFGLLSYNDISLTTANFDITSLNFHTGFVPQQSFRDAALAVYEHLVETQQINVT